MLFGSGRYLFSGSTEYMLCRRCWLEGGPVAAGAEFRFVSIGPVGIRPWSPAWTESSV